MRKLLACGGASVVAFGVMTAASASTWPAKLKPAMDGRYWLIKDDDLAVIGGDGTYNWVSCGITTNPFDVAQVRPCRPGQDRTYTSFFTLRAAIRDGRQRPGTTIIFDQEFWPETPPVESSQHPWRYLRLAGQLAAAHHITIIETPVGDSVRQKNAPIPQQSLEVAAARYAPIVDLQDQYLETDPARYASTVLAAVRAMRAVNRHVIILAGLMGTSGGAPKITPQLMYEDYENVRKYVQGYWLNADQWVPGTGCAPHGCPAVVEGFLSLIGVHPSHLARTR